MRYGSNDENLAPAGSWFARFGLRRHSLAGSGDRPPVRGCEDEDRFQRGPDSSTSARGPSDGIYRSDSRRHHAAAYLPGTPWSQGGYGGESRSLGPRYENEWWKAGCH